VTKITKMKKKVDESKVVGIVYFCDNLKKEIILRDLYSLTASEGECELCGTHGEINLYVTKCECGEKHDIEIRRW
jgi:hypothetical protein